MIGAVVLAAGGSRRLGQPKQLVLHDGRPLIRIAAEAALGAGCAPVVVVVGAAGERIRKLLQDLPLHAVVHDAWNEGLGSTISCGIDALTHFQPDVAAVVLLLCDQPRLSPGIVRALCERWRRGGADEPVAAAYGGSVGAPALFPRSVFERLRKLDGDRGAKSILLERGSGLARIDWPEGAWDVDEPANRRAPTDAL